MNGQRLVLRTAADKRRALALVEALDLAQPVELRLGRAIEDRTAEQNALYWASMSETALRLGLTPAELHDHLLRNFFGFTVRDVGGKLEQVPRRRTTTDEHGDRDVLDSEAWSNFFEWAMYFLAVELAA